MITIAQKKHNLFAIYDSSAPGIFWVTKKELAIINQNITTLLADKPKIQLLNENYDIANEIHGINNNYFTPGND